MTTPAMIAPTSLCVPFCAEHAARPADEPCALCAAHQRLRETQQLARQVHPRSPFCPAHQPAGSIEPCALCAQARRAIVPSVSPTESSVLRELRAQLREEKRKRHAAESALRKVTHACAITPSRLAQILRGGGNTR